MSLTNCLRVALVLVCLWRPAAASAQTSDERSGEESGGLTLFSHPSGSRYWLAGQVNLIFQTHPDFPAVYSGEHSFRRSSEHTTSELFTLYAGIKLTGRSDVLFHLESAAGRGLSDALGIAGFTDLDVVRNPDLGAKPYVARVVYHYAVPLSNEAAPVRRLDVRAGKFGTADYFDVNAVGSDSHLQFLNWTVDNNGAYDYAADTRGYTWGAVAEYHDRAWAVRFGELLMPKVANGIDLDWNLARARAENLEVEVHPAVVPQRPATLRLLSYVNHANMGDYRDAVRRTAAGLDPVPTIENTRRQGRIKYGFGVNVEQPLDRSLRAFARWGWNEPHHESFAYTEVNDTVVAGADAKGERWGRTHDKIGGAFVTNGLSTDHQAYLRLGGQGFLLGDGALRYGRERIIESYYTAHLWRGVFGSADVQHIVHPGYNRDRGPVIVFGLRLHVDV